MDLKPYLDMSPEVADALAAGKPVVALESTIISHGMPYPQNVETALRVEETIRQNGAVPATIAIIGGRLKAGCTREEIEHLGRSGTAVTKASRRDLAVLTARGMDGATTVTTTMMIAHMAGIRIFATGGIGGVHRGAERTMDISADLEELSHTPMMVVCAGAKRSCPPFTPGTRASRWTTGWTARRSWPRSSAPAASWACGAASWSPTPSRRSTPWTRT